MTDRMTLDPIRPDVRRITGPKFVVLWIDPSGKSIEVAKYYTTELARNHIVEKLEQFRGRFTKENYAIAEVFYRVLE